MGRGKVAPPIKTGDWTSVRKAINRLSAQILGSEATPTFAGLTLTDLTASRLMATDASKALASVGDLTSWIGGTDKRVTVSDDLDGSITLTGPQDIDSTASPTFAGVTLNNTGLHLLDTGGDHDLIIKPGSDVSADRTLTLTTGDSDRTITLTGNPTLADWFDQSVKKAASPTFVGLILDKASSTGIKVDTATPTFGFADLLGDQFAKNTGGTRPTLAVYNGVVNAWQFANGDEAFLSYHIPHDYVLGTDIHLHIHWSQNATGATGGTIDFRYTAIYAKGHNQNEAAGSFTSAPITAIFSSIDIDDSGAGLTQYQQHLTEVTISAASATGALFDRDDFEPDGVIELTLEMDADNLTGTASSPFIHYADIHYQTTGLIGTKSRTPDFYG